MPHLQRRREQRAVAPQALLGVRHRLAVGQRVEPPQRRQRVERRPDAAGPAGSGAGADQPGAPAVARRRRRAVRPATPGAPPGSARLRRSARRPGPAPRPHPRPAPARAARKVPTSGPGHERPAELLEDDDGVGHPEAGARRLGQGQREHAGLAERGPVVVADGARVALPGAQALEGQPPGHHGPDALGQRALVLVDAEVHQRALGRPRMRSPTMLRCTCEVPAAMVERDGLEPGVQLLLVAQRPAVAARRSGSAHSAARSSTSMARSPRAWACSEKASLKTEPPMPGDAGLGRLRDVALGERPQRVEGRHQVADAPGQRRRRPVGPAGRPRGAARRSSRTHSSSSPTKAVPRSKDKVTMVTRQPSFSSPTRLATGTRTSLRNSSANSVRALDGAQRPDLDPGRVHGHDEPGDAAVALVARAHEQLAEVGHVGVATSRSSSRSRRSRRRRARPGCAARPGRCPASGSLKPWHHTSSPRRMAGR